MDILVLRATAFNGLLYRLPNLTYWFHLDETWMDVLHILLVVILLVALILSASKQVNNSR
jgi:hypothetical protein